jgi:hypothetical protein
VAAKAVGAAPSVATQAQTGASRQGAISKGFKNKTINSGVLGINW